MSTEHTPGKLVSNGACLVAENGMPIGMTDDYAKSRDEQVANATRLALCWNSHDDLLSIAQKLSLLVNEGDDRMHGVYVDHVGVIRAKGSTLQLIADALAAIARTTS